MRRRLCVCTLLWLFACKPADEVKTATLALHALPSCELSLAKSSGHVRATGDFPSRGRAFDNARLDYGGFPPSTHWLGITLRTSSEGASVGAGGLTAVQFGEIARDVLLLPLDVRHACPLGDPAAFAPAGAAVAALPGGGVLIAGGQEANGGSSRVHVLPAGATLMTEVANGMVAKRVGATATTVGTLVVIAGGGPGDRGPANDSFEVYDTESARFEDVVASKNKLAGSRRDHGSARLGTGRVLIAGGVAEGEADGAVAPLDSAEIIDPVAVHAQAVVGHLTQARIAPELVVLDSGTVLVALGRDASGQALPAPPLERFNPEKGGSFDQIAILPTHAFAAVAALEGERLAYVGCDGDASGCQFWLFGFDGGSVVDLRADVDLSGVGALEQVRLLALHDGRLLLSGRDPSPDAIPPRQAFLIDLAAGLVTARCSETAERARACVDLTRVPDHLLELADGTLMELDEAGASVHRADVASELDDAPFPLIDGSSTAFVLDENGPDGRWFNVNGTLTALQDQSRLDLPHLRFADVRVELTLEHGGAQLLFEPELAAPVELAIDPHKLTLGGCALARGATEKDALVIERHGDTLKVGGDRCTAEKLVGRVGLALRLSAGAMLRDVKITRL